MHLLGFLEQCLERRRVELRKRRSQRLCQFAGDLVPAMQVLFEGAQAFVIPPREHLLTGTLQIRYMNVDRLRLANSIQAADPLLEQFRLTRQIKQHEMMHELEVAPFTPDLGAKENA